ncbi:MAG: hypothetical protein ACE5I5_04900 [Candidatus Heimdallarchaeota archaeon]
MMEKHYLLILKVRVDGSYSPIPFQKEYLSSENALIIIDDLAEIVWVWIGSLVSFVQRSIASRASSYIAKYGYMVDQFKVGAGFTRRLVEEQFFEEIDAQEAYKDFFQLFDIEKTKRNGYYIVEVEEPIRGSILDKEEFQEAKQTMQSWLEEALLVIDGLEERGVAAEAIPDQVKSIVTTSHRRVRAGLAPVREMVGLDVGEEVEVPPVPKITDEHREVRDGIVFSALLQLRPAGYVGRIVEADNSRTFMLLDEGGDLIATVRVRFDDTGRIQIDTYDFKSDEYESIFLRKFGELTSAVI